MAFNSIDEIVDDISAGRMVLMLDDEDRENEGDLLMAASMVRPDDVNFMARYGRGLICLTLSRERCEQLRLPLMVSGSSDHQGTQFTLSIEAAQGVTTGLPAADRARRVLDAYERATYGDGVDRAPADAATDAVGELVRERTLPARAFADFPVVGRPTGCGPAAFSYPRRPVLPCHF